MSKFDFGRWLKQKREEHGMLAVDLAKKAGLTTVSISRYESGTRKPNIKVACDIFKALGISAIALNEFEFVEEDPANVEVSQTG